ncbi:MAG: biotin--[acetyl-CoA-carboxylase] ligase [Deltaproteobacteria bacterium]|nr:biotin--[acetyl-CoA-carboxylase] ligase [Deltaproteobacteria bacterium]
MGRKLRLLDMLKAEKGRWVSGEALSTALCVSRTAVWKHITTLRSEGYEIEASPRRGYRLMGETDALFPREIRAGLCTRRLGQGIVVYREVLESTNDRAKALAAEGAPEGTLVISESQTSGRGRMGRAWFSPRGEGIYLSMILRPRLSFEEIPKLNLLAAVAAADTLADVLGLEVRIKWPNDLLIGAKKVAGILTEAGMEMDAVDFAVIGLGLNVNTREFPEPLKQTATSLFLCARRKFPRVPLVRNFLERFEKGYLDFLDKGFGPVLEGWKRYGDITGQWVEVRMLDRKCRGRVLGLDADGFLLLRTPGGGTQRVLSGDVILKG